MLYLGVDARTRRITAFNDVAAAAQVGPLLNKIAEPVASSTFDGTDDRDNAATAGAMLKGPA